MPPPLPFCVPPLPPEPPLPASPPAPLPPLPLKPPGGALETFGVLLHPHMKRSETPTLVPHRNSFTIGRSVAQISFIRTGQTSGRSLKSGMKCARAESLRAEQTQPLEEVAFSGV